jgi:hypothetical protein
VEIVETHRTLSIRDHRRWFQLFHWSDRTYYFDDLVQFAGGYPNRSARDQKGTWSIRARVGAAHHARKAPHDCGPVPTGFTVNYELLASETPLEETTHDLASPAILADRVQALAFRYETPSQSRVLHFVWQIAPGAGAGATSLAPCPCGKP